MGQTIVITSPGVSTNPDLEKLTRDPLLKGANSGVRFLFDLASTFGYPSQSDPVNADLVRDISEHGDAAVSIIAANAGLVDYAGSGFDFTGCVSDPASIIAPSGALQTIWDATNDYFLVAFYVQLPVKSDWNTSGTLSPLFCATSTQNGYAGGEADLVLIAQGNPYVLTGRRQTAGATAVNTQVVVADAAFGKFAQIAYWRNAAGVGIRCRTADTDQSSTGAVGANNTTDFHAQSPRFGVVATQNNLADGTIGPAHRAATNYRLYRGWVEDLTLSARDPAAVLDADWARTLARGVFA